MSESNETEPAAATLPVPEAVAYAAMWIRLGVLIIAALTTEEAIFFSTVYISPMVNGTFFNTSAITGALGLGLAVFFGAIILWALWSNAPRIARRLFDGMAIPVTPVPHLGRGRPLAVALVVFGAYQLFSAGSLLARALANYFEFDRDRTRYTTPPVFNWSSLAEPGFRFVFGVWLILGLRGAVNLVLRHSGRYLDPAPIKPASANAPTTAE